ncbi:MAG: helix-turn-helix transcriptional regulator [Alphaproteobacteria bacterium]
MAIMNETRGPWAEGGSKMAALRVARELTVAELAEQADLPSVTWLEDVEAGRRPVPSAFYQPLSRELGLSVPDFAGLCLMHYDPRAYEALFGGVSETVLRDAA